MLLNIPIEEEEIIKIEEDEIVNHIAYNSNICQVKLEKEESQNQESKNSQRERPSEKSAKNKRPFKI